MLYKPHIDGLRALAVLPVLLFHAGIPHFEGGFIGVDVFFVISGFLITSIIEDEISSGSFSILSFYERRARRILPALFTVIVACLLAGALLFPPQSFKSLSQSALATTVFGSNFYFWLQPRGYFADVHWNMPLLHTWSLAVEEQFYLFFPPILWVTRRSLRVSQGTVISIILAVSLAASSLGAYAKPSATFYLLPTRMWELMVGALLAIQLPRLTAAAKKLPANALSLAGASLVLLPVTLYSEAMPFPGASAIPPCLGAAALILAGYAASPLIVRSLQSRAAVLVGLISYPLYLWHWPVLTFIYRFQYQTLDGTGAAFALFVSFVAAWLTWRFIELPIRSRRFLTARRLTFFASLAAGSFLCLAGLGGWTTDGFPERIPADRREAAAENVGAQANGDRPCGDIQNAVTDKVPISFCRIGHSGKEIVLFWGDSHVEQTFAEVKRQAQGAGERLPLDIIYATAPGCMPLLGLARNEPNYDCDTLNRAAMARALERDVRRVILSGFWTDFFLFGDFSVSPYKFDRLISGRREKFHDYEDILSFMSAALTEEARTLTAAGKQVVFVMPYPSYPYPVAEYMWRRILYGLTPEVLLTKQSYLTQQGKIRDVIQHAADISGAAIADPAAFLCDSECYYQEGMVSLYKDKHHLAEKGIERIRPMLRQLIGLSPGLELAVHP